MRAIVVIATTPVTLSAHTITMKAMPAIGRHAGLLASFGDVVRWRHSGVY
jgi:hypothetical protein